MIVNRIASLPCSVSLGSQYWCDNTAYHFDKVLHIVGAGQPHCCKRREDADLVVEMTERVPLGLELIQKIADFAKLPKEGFPPRLYVHCTSGMCRGPTAAMVCLIARGKEPGAAMGDIADAMWTQYRDRITPWWEYDVVREIFEWASTT